MYLYDVDKLREGVEYSFKTLKSADINSIYINYTAASYDKRKLYLTYNIGETLGIDHIEYKIYKVVNGEYEDLEMNIENSMPSNNVKKFIDIPNNIGFVTGVTYRIELIPVCKLSNGEYVELDSVYKQYKFKDLFRPYFSVTKSINENTLSYRVNIIKII